MQFLKWFLFIVGLLSIPVMGNGQEEVSQVSIDSVANVLFEQINAKERCDYDEIEKVVLYYVKHQIDSMAVWSRRGIENARLFNEYNEVARFSNFLAKSYFLGSQYELARKTYKDVLAMNASQKQIAKANAGLALNYVYSPHQDSVVYYGLKAEEVFFSSSDNTNRVNNLLTLLQVNLQQSNTHSARKYLDLIEELVFDNEMKDWYGQVYNYAGSFYVMQSDKSVVKDSIKRDMLLDSAYHNYEKAYEKFSQNGMDRFSASALYNLGLIHERKMEWDAALTKYTEGRELVVSFNSPGYLRRFDEQRGAMLFKLGRSNELIPLLKNSVEYYKNNGDYQRLIDTYLELSEAYEGLGNWKEAYRYKNAQINTKIETIDSISIKKIAELETQYQTEQKEKTIAEQNLEIAKSQSKTRLLTGGIVATLLIAGLILWFTQRQSKIQSALQSAEIQSLKQENKIIAMQGILSGQEEERRRIAQDLHDNIGTLMTTIKMKVLGIQKSIADVSQINIAGEIDEMVSQAATEIRRISHNMTPVAMDMTGLTGAIEDLAAQLERNGIRTSFNLDGLDRVYDKEQQVIIYRIVQEIINNVGKHALANSVMIESSVKDGLLHMTIGDDGKGISEVQWKNENGMGIKSIKSRIEYLEGEIDMNNTNGTRYTIKIPVA